MVLNPIRGAATSESNARARNDAIPLTWAKFKPLFDDGRKRGWYTTTAYKDFEYLAYEMAKIIRKTDPNFMGKSALFKSEYDEAFKSGKQAPPTP